MSCGYDCEYSCEECDVPDKVIEFVNEYNQALQIIELAKNKYPVSIPYKGRLTEEEITELEKECDVHCASVYMDGTGYYFIRYREVSRDWGSGVEEWIQRKKQ